MEVLVSVGRQFEIEEWDEEKEMDEETGEWNEDEEPKKKSKHVSLPHCNEQASLSPAHKRRNGKRCDKRD